MRDGVMFRTPHLPNATNLLQKPPTPNPELERALEDIRLESVRYAAVQKSPWIDEDGRVVWSPFRIRLGRIILSQRFEVFMGIIIVANIILMWLETDNDANCIPQYPTLEECPFSSSNNPVFVQGSQVFLAMYTFETMTRFFVERWEFFSNKWNLLDLLIVVLGWVSDLIGNLVNLNFLRACRVARLLRAARVLLAIRELYMLINGMASSMKTIVYGACMLIAMLILWAILVVQLLHPVNAFIAYEDCPRCSRGFETVGATVLTLFQQIVAGDEWGQISVPVIEADPGLGAPILVGIVFTVSLGLMNLILAVIVERAAEAREQDTQNRAKQKEEERKRTMIALATLCAQMDRDGSGTLSLEELLRGYDHSADFQNLMRVMDVQRGDMATVFNTLGSMNDPCVDKGLTEDGDLELSYSEFCKHIHMVKSKEVRMMVLELSQVVYGIKNTLDSHKVNCSTKLSRIAHVLERMQDGRSAAPASGLPPSGTSSTATSSMLKTGSSPGKFIPRTAQSNHSSPDKAYSFDTLEQGPPIERAISKGSVATSCADLTTAPSHASQAPQDIVITDEFARIRKKMQDLSSLKGDIIRRLEDQMGLLSAHEGSLAECQASILEASAVLAPAPNGALGGPPGSLASLGGAKREGPRLKIASTSGYKSQSADDPAGSFADKVFQLRKNVEKQFAVAERFLARGANEDAMLLTNGHIVDGFGSMSCQGVQGLSLRGVPVPAAPPEPDEHGALGLFERKKAGVSVPRQDAGAFGAAPGRKFVEVSAQG